MHNGDQYDGDWVNGKKHGDAIYTYKSGKVVKGVWKDNECIQKAVI